MRFSITFDFEYFPLRKPSSVLTISSFVQNNDGKHVCDKQPWHLAYISEINKKLAVNVVPTNDLATKIGWTFRAKIYHNAPTISEFKGRPLSRHHDGCWRGGCWKGQPPTQAYHQNLLGSQPHLYHWRFCCAFPWRKHAAKPTQEEVKTQQNK